jgi:drug/metabolite transporter (DMT)-like permease
MLQYIADLTLGLARHVPPQNSRLPPPVHAIRSALTRAAHSQSPAVNALVVAVPALDVTGALLTFVSISNSSSAVFQAFFGGYLLVLPLLARIILSRTLAPGQIFGMAIIALGLVLNFLRIWTTASASSSLPYGAYAAIAATVVYSFRTVLMDTLINRYKSVYRSELQRVVGVWGALSMAIAAIVKYSSASRRAELVRNVIDAGASRTQLALIAIAFFGVRLLYTSYQCAHCQLSTSQLVATLT